MFLLSIELGDVYIRNEHVPDVHVVFIQFMLSNELTALTTR